MSGEAQIKVQGFGRHRALHHLARDLHDRRTVALRDRARRQARSSAARANARVRSSSSRSRPTIVNRRCGAPARSPKRPRAVGGRGRALPSFERERLDRPTRTASRTRAWVPSPIRISPRGGGLEPGGRVHGIAGDATEIEVSAPTSTSPVFTPMRQASRTPWSRSSSRLRSRAPCACRRGSDGAERIVLMELRNAEHGHHGVPDELLDGAP